MSSLNKDTITFSSTNSFKNPKLSKSNGKGRNAINSATKKMKTISSDKQNFGKFLKNNIKQELFLHSIFDAKNLKSNHTKTLSEELDMELNHNKKNILKTENKSELKNTLNDSKEKNLEKGKFKK